MGFLFKLRYFKNFLSAINLMNGFFIYFIIYLLFFSRRSFFLKTVLITDSGSWVEYTKVDELTRSKELGKMIL